MTEYVKSTNFASKDALATGNPLKIVKGTEIDTEFNNIATAIATKADLNSPTFIGTPAAPTAAGGTNTTQIATTAFVTTAIAAAVAATKAALFPVGSIYTNATDNTNPATLLGFGTWVSFGAGRVPVGFDAGDTLFNAAEKTGGSKDATLVAHTHTGTTGGQSANHSHSFSGTTGGQSNGHSHLTGNNAEGGTPWGGPTARYGFEAGWSVNRNATASGTGYDTYTSGNLQDHSHAYSGTTGGVSSDHTHSFTTASTGSSATNANVQPYITVYMWKRTA